MQPRLTFTTAFKHPTSTSVQADKSGKLARCVIAFAGTTMFQKRITPFLIFTNLICERSGRGEERERKRDRGRG